MQQPAKNNGKEKRNTFLCFSIFHFQSQITTMTLVTIPIPKSLPSTPMQETTRAVPPVPLRTPTHQVSGAESPRCSDCKAEANRSGMYVMGSPSRRGYGPGLFDIPTAALSTGSFVAPASPSRSPFKYWQPQQLQTQQRSQSAQAKEGTSSSSHCVGEN